MNRPLGGCSNTWVSSDCLSWVSSDCPLPNTSFVGVPQLVCRGMDNKKRAPLLERVLKVFCDSLRLFAALKSDRLLKLRATKRMTERFETS
jgi:hypothetical protein